MQMQSLTTCSVDLHQTEAILHAATSMAQTDLPPQASTNSQCVSLHDCAPSAPIRSMGAAFTATIYDAVNTKYLASSFGPVGAFTPGGHEVPNGSIPLYLLRRQARVTLLTWRKQAL